MFKALWYSFVVCFLVKPVTESNLVLDESKTPKFDFMCFYTSLSQGLSRIEESRIFTVSIRRV